MTKVHVVLHEYEQFIEGSKDENDSWDRHDTQSGVEEIEVLLQEYHMWSEEFEIDDKIKRGQVVYVVLANYDTGDTFGRDYNKTKVVEVFTSADDAHNLVKIINNQRADYSSDGKIDRNYNFFYKNKQYYKFWEGYFESLNGARYESIQVR